MLYLSELVLKALGQVWVTLEHNWPFLVVSTLVAAGMKLYLDRDAIAGFLRRHQGSGVFAATAAGVATPLCSCGTTAIILGMLAGSMPWAPIIAFMVASPLTSPEELFYSAGLFGWPFALAFFIASIVLGLLGGAAAHVLDLRGWLANQARFAEGAGEQKSRGEGEQGCQCDSSHLGYQAPIEIGASEPIPLRLAPVAVAPCGCGESHVAAIELSMPSCCAGVAQASSWSVQGVAGPIGLTASARQAAVRLAREVFDSGRRLLVYFLAFAFVGYLLNDLIPAAWIPALFGGGHAYSVPLAATLGLPFYINTEASLPLVRAMLDSGMSQGAALAFLITGAGTSIGAVAGALTIARWRVLAVVIGTLWAGAILSGLAFDGLLAAGIL